MTSPQVPRRQAGVGSRVSNSFICTWDMGVWSQKGFLVAVARASFHLLYQPLSVSDYDLAHYPSSPPGPCCLPQHCSAGKVVAGAYWPRGIELLCSTVL